MNFISTIIVFILFWWLIFFSLLPIGIKKELNPTLGHDRGAPSNQRLVIKFMFTTIGAVFLTALIYYIVDQEWIALWV
ncbi:MAG: hypothetical protein BGO77_04725 [Caedibacter sp. 37-49]|nr:MAG: hypothetical protein BGO77_04725 [Caedibacter sp. 37-49]